MAHGLDAFQPQRRTVHLKRAERWLSRSSAVRAGAGSAGTVVPQVLQRVLAVVAVLPLDLDSLRFRDGDVFRFADRHLAEGHCTRSMSRTPEMRRMAAVTRGQEIVMKDAPWVFITYPGFHLAHGKDIGGLVYYTSNRLSFRDYTRKS